MHDLTLCSNFEKKLGSAKSYPKEKFYLEKKSTLEKVYPGKNPQFLTNLYETW